MSISQNFPATWPSLTLDFANSKTLDPRITFTRSSTATYVGNDGLIKTATVDQARFDHDPATGESLGLLIEESRINYAINSENLDTWGTGRCIVTANQIISPDGQLTAEELKFNNTSSNPLIYRAKPGSGVYAISCFFKKGSVNGAYIYIDNPSLTAAIFDLENGITKAYDNTKFSSTSIEDYGNGWYRCSAITISISGSNYGFGPCTPESATTGVTCPTDGSVYAWGTQIEAGSFPTSYIPTSGSAITRSADLASISGDSFSKFYNPNGGTAYIDLISKGVNADNAAYQVYFSFNSDASNRWGISHQNESRGSYAANAVLPYVGQAGVFDVITRFSKTLVPGSRNKYTMTQPNGSDVKIMATGVQGFTSGITSKTPAINQLYLGHVIGDNGNLNGTIAEFRYYPEALTSDQITTLIK